MKMMGTFICAVDDSAEAEEALRVAALLCTGVDCRLLVVHVVDAAGSGSAFRRSADERGRRFLDRLLAAHDLDGTDRRVEVGAPARELARVAAEEAACLILVGSGRARRWRRRLPADLAATAGCPVVVVPPAAPGQAVHTSTE